ncbi:protein takeout-like isoform X2 [Tribolium madens]|uniref:protein takeout-like isoform X2 n=1 Tax=Tribolium madens TaxID=41895 RepID=UPI001CF73F0A|nr:protein takeout-like isoform X2 [Tribolium madens]
MSKCLVVFLVIIADLSESASFKKCSRNDNQCLTLSIKDALEQLTVPIKEVGLPSLDPLEIPALSIGAGTGPVQFNQNYKNFKIYGFTKVESINATLTENILKIDLHVLETLSDFEYEVDGKILIFPIKGKGTGMITVDKPEFILTFNLEEYEKEGEKYLKVINKTLSIKPQKMHFEFSNDLFGGDKEFTNIVKTAMNENWKDIYADVGPSYEEAYGQIFMSIFNNLLSKVPISELFNS